MMEYLNVIKALGTLFIGISSIFIAWHFRIVTRVFARRVSWELDANFIKNDSLTDLCEVTITITNEGQTRLEIPALYLEIFTLPENIVQGQVSGYRIFTENIFPATNIIMDKNGAFVEPGVTEKITYLLSTPVDKELLLFHANYCYSIQENQETNIRRIICNRE